MEQLVELDREIYLFLNNLGNPAWDDFWNFITNKWSSIPLYAILVYLLYRQLGLKATLIALLCVAGLITFTDQLANVFKHGFERPRPCRQEGVMERARFIAEHCGRFGYFSAHAASSVALAVFMSAIFRKVYPVLVYILIIWALMVSYSRIYVGVHYPLDVLTGWVVGCIGGYLFYKLQEFLVRKYAT